MSNIFAGCKQVDTFGPDEDYEDAVEEHYVTLDLGVVDPTLLPNSSTYRLIGLDSPTPFLQLSGTIFKGKHCTLLGTELIFSKNEAHEEGSRSGKHVTHVANTERRIRFQEVQLKAKKEPAQKLTFQNYVAIDSVEEDLLLTGEFGADGAVEGEPLRRDQADATNNDGNNGIISSSSSEPTIHQDEAGGETVDNRTAELVRMDVDR